jgi:dienelactone hydrolase
MFISVLGISRNASEHAHVFHRPAERYGVVLVAPLFSPDRFPDYQRLGQKGRGERADRMLDRIVAEGGHLTGASANKLYFFGYSGGGQFVHRYMAHPQRVAAAGIAAVGWYTFPDPNLKFPAGIGKTRSLPDVSFNPDRLLTVPACVFAGDSPQNWPLRKPERVGEYQETARIDRGQQWVEAMTEAARARGLDTRYSFQTYPRAAHSFARSVKRGKIYRLVFECLFGPAPQRT